MEEGDAGGIWPLSHWLSDRSQTYSVLLPEPEAGAVSPAGEAVAPPVHEERRRIYESLAPFLEHLPGIPVRVVDMLRTGRLDRTLQRLAAQTDARSHEQLTKLRAIREAILRQARRRCTLRQQLALFDAIEDLGEPEATLAPAPALPAAPQEPRDPGAADARRTYLLNEVRLVRSLLRLGAPGSGVTRVHTVLAGHPARFRRGAVIDLVRLIHECDPRLPDPFRICVAPYTGTGFFEWDRDTVFLPLTPTRTSEEALLAAVAHYRLMIDSLQDGGVVRRRYETEFGRDRVERRFLEDYRLWVLGAGRGIRGAFSDRTFEFFRDNIGPSAETLFAPSDIRTLAPHEAELLAEECRQRIQQGRGEGADHYRLALLSWREGKGKASLEHMAQAVRADRANGGYLFTLGYLCSLRGMRDKSREAYHACNSRAPSTLWAVYAQDALKRSE
jgi:hypothetical protein